MKKIIISPPFGNYLKFKWATSVKGTWTAHPRPGNRVMRAIKTIRPISSGWINKMGMINKGIRAYSFADNEVIYSVSARNGNNWSIIADMIPENKLIELNISCPNVKISGITDDDMKQIYDKSKLVIIKLSPRMDSSLSIVERAMKIGINHFHCCNTIPTMKGGVSGSRLKWRSLRMILKIQESYPDAILIGGGGIYSPEDVRDYKELDVDYFSLSTIWFTPWKVYPVVKEIYKD